MRHCRPVRALVSLLVFTLAPACRPAPAVPGAAEERISALHLLVSWQGAVSAPPEVTRSRDEARLLAESLRRRALAGEDFAALAREFSDERGARTGRQWGSFDRGALIKPLSDAAFALAPDEVSAVVETDRGFHLMRRRPLGQEVSSPACSRSC